MASPNSVVVIPVASSDAGQGSGNAPGNLQRQPEAASIAGSISPNIQLQPISAAIFNNQQPSNIPPPDPSRGPGAPLGNNDPPPNKAPQNNAPPNNAPQNNAPPNNVPPNNAPPNDAPQNNAPQNNGPPAAPGRGDHEARVEPASHGLPPGNPTRYAGVASPASPGQGVPAGPTEQAALTRGADGGLVIGSSTIMPGQAATINSHQVSVGSSNVIVDGNTYAFAPPTTPAPIPITVAGLSMQSASNGGVILAGQTLVPGVQTTIGSHTVSVGSGNVVVDGNTQILPTATPAPPQPLIGSSTMLRASNGAVVIGSSTLPVDSQATIGGHVISVGTANVVIDGTTNALATTAATASPILLDGQTIQQASNGGMIIGTSTLAPGTQTTIAGHVISVGNNNVVLDSSTFAIPPVARATFISSPNAGAQRNAITLPNSSVLRAGGSPVTISGEIISILSNDQGAVIDGSTMPFASPTAQSVFTVAGQTFTAAPSSFVVGGATVSLGGAPVTIAGTVVSLGPSGLRIGSMTIPLPTATPTGLEGYTISEFNAPTNGVNSTDSVGEVSSAPGANSTGSVGGGSSATSANNTGSVVGGPIATGASSTRSVDERPSATGTKAQKGSGARLKGDIWLIGATVIMCMGIGVAAVLM